MLVFSKARTCKYNKNMELQVNANWKEVLDLNTKNETITIRLDKELMKKTKDYASSLGDISLAAVVRIALSEKFKNTKEVM